MFDSVPNNLPIEPQTPPNVNTPAPQPTVNGSSINVSGKKEPEDIFADVDPAMSANMPQPSAQMQPPKPSAGFPWKVILGIGIPLVVIALGIGGWYLVKSFSSTNSNGGLVLNNTQPATVPITSEPGNEVTEKDMIPAPNQDELAASQATLSLLQAQADKEQQALGEEPMGDLLMESTSSDALNQEESISAPETVPNIAAPQNGLGLVMGLDSDGDGLTNSEELVLGTDPNIIDSDGDGYSDLSELQSGYDPAQSNAKLDASTHIIQLNIGVLSSLMPSAWSKKPGNNGSVTIQTGTPATITINTEAFADTGTLIAWLMTKYPGTMPGDFESGDNIFGADVVYSKDKITAWLLKGNMVYVFRYAANGGATMDYQSIFTLMVKNAK